MADMVPFILAQEQQLLKKEISGKFVSTIFDGTTRLGEAVVRYVDDSWVIQQRLICLKVLEKSMTGEEIAQVVMDTLSRFQHAHRKGLIFRASVATSVNVIHALACIKIRDADWLARCIFPQGDA